MKSILTVVVTSVIALAAGGGLMWAAGAGLLAAAQHTHQQMLEAGNHAMGFDQTRTFHHFRLLPNGGVIEVHVNDPADDDSRRKIAAHLEHIGHQFSAGDFAASLATHGEEPPGVVTLKRLHGRVQYAFVGTPVGGRVRIATDDTEALTAVHAFLRYQIREHRTGDATDVEGR
jgi:hypothetical protein